MELKNQKILAIDYGSKFTGIATFYAGHDPFPLPYGRIKFQSEDQLIREIKTICDNELVTLVVFGVPKFTDGTESTMSKTIRAFGEKLKVKLGLPFFEQDETLTTFEAEERMKNSPRYNFKVDLNAIDALSASIILEEFIASFSSPK
jgi:putative Holliday junction resolvase